MPGHGVPFNARLGIGDKYHVKREKTQETSCRTPLEKIWAAQIDAAKTSRRVGHVTLGEARQMAHETHHKALFVHKAVIRNPTLLLFAILKDKFLERKNEKVAHKRVEMLDRRIVTRLELLQSRQIVHVIISFVRCFVDRSEIPIALALAPPVSLHSNLVIWFCLDSSRITRVKRDSANCPTGLANSNVSGDASACSSRWYKTSEEFAERCTTRIQVFNCLLIDICVSVSCSIDRTRPCRIGSVDSVTSCQLDQREFEEAEFKSQQSLTAGKIAQPRETNKRRKDVNKLYTV